MWIRKSMMLSVLMVASSMYGFGSEDLEGFDEVIRETAKSWSSQDTREVKKLGFAVVVSAIFVLVPHYAIDYMHAQGGNKSDH